MTIKVKLGTLAAANRPLFNGISALASMMMLKVPVKVGWDRMLNFEEIEGHTKRHAAAVQKIHDDIVRKYGAPGPDGELRVAEDSENFRAARAELDSLLNGLDETEVTLSFDPVPIDILIAQADETANRCALSAATLSLLRFWIVK
jgi:hypothetical protein